MVNNELGKKTLNAYLPPIYLVALCLNPAFQLHHQVCAVDAAYFDELLKVALTISSKA